MGFFNQVEKGLAILPVLRYSSGHRKGRFEILSVLKVRLGNVRRVIGAKLADDDVAANLAISASSPVRYVERNYFFKHEMLLRTAGFYRSDLFRYEIKLKREPD